jgi:hypothetical protein
MSALFWIDGQVSTRPPPAKRLKYRSFWHESREAADNLSTIPAPIPLFVFSVMQSIRLAEKFLNFLEPAYL